MKAMSSRLRESGYRGNLPIDALRGLLILLGILLHAARPYDGTGDWLVAGQAGASWLRDLALSIGFFRMPLFFFLSGLLSWSTLVRRSGGSYLQRRVVRLGVPLVFAAIVFNAAVAWLLGGKAAMGQPLTLAYWINGEWLLHLWFLLYLLIYSAMLALVRPLLLRLPRLGAGAGVHGLIAAGFVAAGFAAEAVAQVFPGVYAAIGHYGTLFWLIHFGAYFLLGAVACQFLGDFERLVEPPGKLVPIFVGAAVLVGLRLALRAYDDDIVWEIVRTAADGLLLWCLLHILIAFSTLLAKWAPAACRVVAEASYSIYLIHHSVVVMLAVALQSFAIEPEGKFWLVVAITLVFSIACHLLVVQRFAILRALVNGKWERA